MSEEHQQRCERLRAALGQLFKDAGYETPELHECIDAFEREPLAVNLIEELSAENERLNQEIEKMRQRNQANPDRPTQGSAMSTKLKEALRE